jgi:hypothetical protein
MTQIWYFQLESLLHLPFMLRASTERRYEYSKFTCLKASREVIDRYILLRGAKHNLFCCNVVDFGMCNIPLCLANYRSPNSRDMSSKQLIEDIYSLKFYANVMNRRSYCNSHSPPVSS